MTEAEAYDGPANGYRASKTFAVGSTKANHNSSANSGENRNVQRGTMLKKKSPTSPLQS